MIKYYPLKCVKVGGLMDKEFLKYCLEKGMSTRDIEKICDKKRSTISYWINKYDLKEYMKFQKKDNYKFEKIDTPEKAYTLGFVLADGCINNKNVEIAVALRDKCVIDFIAKVINANVHTSTYLNKKTRQFPYARICKKITDITKFTGGYVKKDRHYPRVREDLERYLILGLFDADGCITWGRRKDKNRIWQKVLFASQLNILTGVQRYLINKLGISTVVRPKAKEDCYVLEFANKSDVIKFCKHIYPDEEFIILKRKYLKYKALRLELEENGENVA